MVQRTDVALSVLGHDGKDGFGGYFIVVKEIRAMAGDQDLCVLASVPETIYQYAGSGGMQCKLRLFNTPQPGTRFAVAGALKQGTRTPTARRVPSEIPLA